MSMQRIPARLHARSARMRTARHKAPCRFVYNAAAAAEMHAPYGRGYAAAGRTSVQCVEREARCRSAGGLFSKQKVAQACGLGEQVWFLENKKRQTRCLPFLSGKRDSDPRPQPWQGCALPTELFPRFPFGECKDRKFLLICKI